MVRRVAAFASRDARAWRPVGEAALLELHAAAGGPSTAQRLLALHTIAPDEPYLQLQLNAPLALLGVFAEMQVAAPVPPLDSERFRLSRAEAASWTLDSEAALPVRQLQIHVPQENSVLPLAVERRLPDAADGQPGAWAKVADHTAYRVVRDGVTVNSPPLNTPGAAVRNWRFTLLTRMAPPDVGLDATLSWSPVQLVFAARGPGPFRLALGHPQAQEDTIARAALIPGYREGDEFKLPLLRPGPAVERPVAAPSIVERLAQAGPQQHRRWVLWGTLSMAVVVLALLARRLSRDLRAGRARSVDA
jgi:hypothetical protein